ncbi:MAG: hypothetical protein KME17_12480, partial [Cyanosarcina radialis HA8281-LM2]|nr:hypothetical protein [Cyanosarcina radialis HA8281-LM2]
FNSSSNSASDSLISIFRTPDIGFTYLITPSLSVALFYPNDIIDRLGYESWVLGNYNWQYFRNNSAFEQVGKQLCRQAATDRRIYSVW